MFIRYLLVAILNDQNDENPEDSAPVEYADEVGVANQELPPIGEEYNNVERQGSFMRAHANHDDDIEVREDPFLARRVPDAYQVHIQPNAGRNLLDQVVPQDENQNVVISDRVQLQANLDLLEEELENNIFDMEEGLYCSQGQQ